jgi:hypothetical protein
MRAFSIKLASVAAIALMLGACEHYGGFPDYSELPPDYSPRYTAITVVTPSGREKRVLVPEACLHGEPPSAAEMGPPRIPPGCANNYNIQRMAERKRDLVHGRKLGPAPGATTARAAQRYLDGKEGPLGGAVESDENVPAQGAGTATTQ